MSKVKQREILVTTELSNYEISTIVQALHHYIELMTTHERKQEMMKLQLKLLGPVKLPELVVNPSQLDRIEKKLDDLAVVLVKGSPLGHSISELLMDLDAEDDEDEN